MDLAGDGQPDLVVLDGPMPGFYEHDAMKAGSRSAPSRRASIATRAIPT